MRKRAMYAITAHLGSAEAALFHFLAVDINIEDGGHPEPYTL